MGDRTKRLRFCHQSSSTGIEVWEIGEELAEFRDIESTQQNVKGLVETIFKNSHDIMSVFILERELTL